jgi:hypothetical protein
MLGEVFVFTHPQRFLHAGLAGPHAVKDSPHAVVWVWVLVLVLVLVLVSVCVSG